ncbi:MAG: type V CRISPR-associated protein Cas4 [Clostridiales bacterium]|nr:type V CRISPR-associated protein Cas4 [Clostridiales bacterium]
MNDFIFCPVSIYFHSLEEETDDFLYKDSYQFNSSAAHERSDSGNYSSRKTMLQAISVYSSEFNLLGKIDTFDAEKGILTERKKRITTIYDGYIFQVYAQYFALTELGYEVNEIRLYSMDDNKIYPVKKPEDDLIMFEKFKNVIEDIENFDYSDFKQNNKSKCERCIYEPLCSYSALKGEIIGDYCP